MDIQNLLVALRIIILSSAICHFTSISTVTLIHDPPTNHMTVMRPKRICSSPHFPHKDVHKSPHTHLRGSGTRTYRSELLYRSFLYSFPQGRLIVHLTTSVCEIWKKMRAARYYGPKDIRVDEIPEPEPQQGQVKVKVGL